MININNFDLNKIELDQRSYKNILIYYIGFVTVEDFSYATTKSVNPLNLIINKINGYVEWSKENKYLVLVSTNKIKDTLKEYEEPWSEISDLNE